MTLVPLGLLRKRTLLQFDLADEQGNRLPLATHDQHERLATAALGVIAELVLGSRPSPATLTKLQDLVGYEGDDPDAAVEALGSGWRRLTGPSAPTEGDLLLQDADFRRWALNFAGGYLLLVPLRGKGRHVFKFAYTEALGTWESEAARPSFLRTLPHRFAQRPLVFAFDIPGIGESRSYHLEVHAPAGLQVSGVAFHLGPGAAAKTQRPPIHMPTIAHFNVSGAAPEDEALAIISMAAPREGFMWRAAVACVLVTVVLAYLAGLGLSKLKSVDEAVTILLASQGVAPVLATRAGEHPLASRFLNGIRFVATAVAALTFAAALQVATRLKALCPKGLESAPCLRPTMWWWAGASLLLSTIVVRALWRARHPSR